MSLLFFGACSPCAQAPEAETPFCEDLDPPPFSLVDLVGSELKGLAVTPDMAIVDTVVRQSAALLDADHIPRILLREKPKCPKK